MAILTREGITDVGSRTLDLLKKYHDERLRLTAEQRNNVEQSRAQKD
jgi:hypothetical protein